MMSDIDWQQIRHQPSCIRHTITIRVFELSEIRHPTSDIILCICKEETGSPANQNLSEAW